MPLPKRPDDGEAGRFTSITPNGKAYDPTQPSGKSNPPTIMPSRSTNGGRWNQWSPGQEDDQGAHHDW